MIYSVSGKIISRGEGFFVLDASGEDGGLSFKIFTNERTLNRLPPESGPARVFTFLYIREERLELYGFLEEQTLRLFEMLNTVAGVGPRTALGVLDTDEAPNIMAAIIERRADFLTKASGIGRKTAERIILELQGRIKLPGSKTLTEKMTLDAEVEEALVSLGYSRGDIRRALPAIDRGSKTLEGRLKEALRFLGRRH